MNRYDWMRKTADELGYEINSLRRWADRPGFPLMGTAAEVKAWHGKNVNQNGPPSKAERQRIAARDRELMKERRVEQLSDGEPRGFKWFHDAAGEFVTSCDWMFDPRPQSNGRELTDEEREFARIYIAESCALALLRCRPGYTFPGSTGGGCRYFYMDLLAWFDENLPRFEREHDDPQFDNQSHPSRIYEARADEELASLQDETEPG